LRHHLHTVDGDPLRREIWESLIVMLSFVRFFNHKGEPLAPQPRTTQSVVISRQKDIAILLVHVQLQPRESLPMKHRTSDDPEEILVEACDGQVWLPRRRLC